MGQRGDNQSLESWQMGDAPRDLSGPRGTTGLGDPGRYSFGEDAGQQGTGPGVGFALPEYGSNLDAAPPPSASGAMASGGPGQWALPTTGTGIIGAPGAPTFVGPGQWASPTMGMHLIIFKLFMNCRATWGTPQNRQCRCWREIQAKQTLRNAGDWYRDWTNHASGQRARLSPESTRRSSVQKIGENPGHYNRPKQNPRRGRNIV
jgi:hypothetical protein